MPNRNVPTQKPVAAVYVGTANGVEFRDPVLFNRKSQAAQYAARVKSKGMHARIVTDQPLKL